MLAWSVAYLRQRMLVWPERLENATVLFETEVAHDQEKIGGSSKSSQLDLLS